MKATTWSIGKIIIWFSGMDNFVIKELRSVLSKIKSGLNQKDAVALQSRIEKIINCIVILKKDKNESS